jgi:hypothetical protein
MPCACNVHLGYTIAHNSRCATGDSCDIVNFKENLGIAVATDLVSKAWRAIDDAQRQNRHWPTALG